MHPVSVIFIPIYAIGVYNYILYNAIYIFQGACIRRLSMVHAPAIFNPFSVYFIIYFENVHKCMKFMYSFCDISY